MSSNFPQNSSRDIRTQVRCRSTRTAKRRYLRFRKRNHQQSRAMASCTLLFPLALLILPFSLLGARTRLLPSRLPALMMAFFPLLASPPVFLPFLPSGARALFPCARVRLNRLLLRRLLVRHPRPLVEKVQNGEGGVGQTVAAPMANWGEEAARLAQGRVPCGLHQI